jgi:hypothetical protein
VPDAAEVIAEVCVLDYAKAGKPDIDWDDPTAKQELVSTLVNDALAVLARLCRPGAPVRDPGAADALGLLALVAGQDVEPADGSDGTDGRWRIARRVAPDRVISTVDPQTRHTRKSKSVRRDGYRAHLACEPETGLITDAELTMATGDANTDAAMGVTMTGRDRFHTHDHTAETAETAEGGGLEVYGDSAYGSGEAREAYRKAGHDTMIKPKPVQPAVPGGFTLDDFTVNEQDATVTCPGGHTRPITKSRTVTFGKLCTGCPLRDRCTTAKTGRSMTIHQYEALLREARTQGRTPEFKQAYPTRSNVERTVAHVATQNGRRIKLRHVGTKANHAWLRTRAAALNLRTMLKHGLTHLDGAWALA